MLLALPLYAADPKLPPDFKPYTETIPGTKIEFKMVPIPGGTFRMGSADDEKGRQEDEGPPIEVTVKPFWMGVHEVTWDEYDVFAFGLDIRAAKEAEKTGTPLVRTENDKKADAVTRPTPPYVDMTFGYGHDGYPAICMTQHAAAQYCKWLATKTGKPFRLPSEAEWEFACRAGSTTPYYFGSDPKKLGEHAWFFENSNEKPHPVGKKAANPWGLHDMHGNVSEWCLDKYLPDSYAQLSKQQKSPLVAPMFDTKETVWHSARGGSWEDDAALVRSAARRGADEEWSIQDPQEPKSIWWHTDAHFVGFRVIRPYEPKKE
jgi:formylglycine-generating enzyme required for sulfatase activity